MRNFIVGLGCALILASFGCGSSTSDGAPSKDDTGSTDTAVAADGGGDETATDAPLDTGGSGCTSARDTALGPVDKVSTGAVTSLAVSAGGVKTLYVDASAGGVDAAKRNPWVYLDLATGTRVDITDPASYTSSDWDLALKRPILHANSGDGGPGGGGAAMLSKRFDEVTLADATAATMKTEKWFDDECILVVDAIGSVKTSFDGWYEYDGATTKVTPKSDVTWIVRGAKGGFYKIELQSYYSNPDGTEGSAGGRYKLRVAALK